MMRKAFYAAVLAASASVSMSAAAQTVGNPVTDRATVDTCSQCTFVINDLFPAANRRVGTYSFFAENAADITPLLLSRNDTGTVANFTVLAIGQQRTAALGANTFSFDAVQGVNRTLANTYFGFAYPGAGVVSFDYAPGSPNTGAFVGPASFVPTAVGQTFSSDFSSQPANSYGALNARTYSITAAAVPEPATWAMLIGGFGVVGGAMRRRKARPALSAA